VSFKQGRIHRIPVDFRDYFDENLPLAEQMAGE